MDRPSRRQFLQGSLALAGLGLLSGCGVLPPQAQPPPKLPRVGVLLPYAADSAPSREMLEPFRAGLQELGYVEGQNIDLEYRFSSGENERFPELVAELIRLPVDVIVAEKHDAILAAKQATSTIPIVMSVHADPVGLGLVASLAHPGGNITGMTSLAARLSGKRLELLRETSPAVSRVVVFYDHTYPSAQLMGAEATTGAGALGLELLAFDVRTPADFGPVFEAARRERADGLYVFGDPLIVRQQRQLIDFAAQQRIPAVYSERSWSAAGGLMAYGPHYPAIYRRAAYYVDRILKGAKPADLPVEQPREFELVINLKTAQALGLTIPESVLQQATEVIQ